MRTDLAMTGAGQRGRRGDRSEKPPSELGEEAPRGPGPLRGVAGRARGSGGPGVDRAARQAGETLEQGGQTGGPQIGNHMARARTAARNSC